MDKLLNCFILALVLAVSTQVVMSGHLSDCPDKYQKVKGHTACLKKDPRAKSLVMTDAIKKIIVDTHNELRANVTPKAANMMKMSWDNELQMIAEKWADACGVRGGINHDSIRFIPGGMSVGQNLQGGTFDFKASIESWFEEGFMYVFDDDFYNFYRKNHWGIMVGHYTQMVWAKSHKIGCAATRCGRGRRGNEIIVCNYGQAGNILPFKKPYEDGKPCSMCKHCTSNGLCDCPDIKCNGGRLDPATCTCDCKIDGKLEKFMSGPNCDLNCEGTKDIWYCGYPGFNNCAVGGVNYKCPHMCKRCP